MMHSLASVFFSWDGVILWIYILRCFAAHVYIYTILTCWRERGFLWCRPVPQTTMWFCFCVVVPWRKNDGCVTTLSLSSLSLSAPYVLD